MLNSRFCLATTLDQDLSDDVGPNAEFVPSHAASPAALAPRMICLQVPTLDAPTRPSDAKGHLQRGLSRTLKARAFLDILAFTPGLYVCHFIPGSYARSFTPGLYACCFETRPWGFGYVFCFA
jgi:hypothetical protein